MRCDILSQFELECRECDTPYPADHLLLARQRRAAGRHSAAASLLAWSVQLRLFSLPIYRVFVLFLFSVYLSFRFGHHRHRAPRTMSFRGIKRARSIRHYPADESVVYSSLHPERNT
jgi:hypothetical protein